jgi:hypothetical protein
MDWFVIRDLLIGENGQVQDFEEALRLARLSKHPDAVWLCSLFDGKAVPRNKKEAQAIVDGSDTKDEPRSVFFSCMWGNFFDSIRLVASAQAGYAAAQARICRFVPNSIEMAQKSADQVKREEKKKWRTFRKGEVHF